MAQGAPAYAATTIEVAASAIACVICPCVSGRSVPAATAPPKIVAIEPWKPRSPHSSRYNHGRRDNDQEEGPS